MGRVGAAGRPTPICAKSDRCRGCVPTDLAAGRAGQPGRLGTGTVQSAIFRCEVTRQLHEIGAMNTHFAVTPDDVIEQILIQCWLHEARAGGHAAARRRAEETLGRLLAKGLPFQNGPHGMRLDPYTANNLIKSRAGELDDDAWAAWLATARRNAVSLPAGPC